MTSLIAWTAADSRGPSSLNLAADSKISWPGTSSEWNEAQKVFASSVHPLAVGFAGTLEFPSTVLPSIIERIDRGLAPNGSRLQDVVTSALRHAWSSYRPPRRESQEIEVLIASRDGAGMQGEFGLRQLSCRHASSRADDGWSIQDVNIPPGSTAIRIVGSGASAVKRHIGRWQTSDAANTSRAVFSGFVDAIVSGVDRQSGGAPQLASIYRVGPARLLGVVHGNQRYFAGSHLVGNESTGGVEWRTATFERADGDSKVRLSGAQRQPRPPLLEPPDRA
ncbi:hypothetical protein ACI3KX_00535 [Microbacterium sp. ZW CA_36]|uniref:hypothetical protein n=1 Tax=Microbacterium sp. ZW CA_36 TaxID=3378078 RepID=UPI003852DA69